MLIIVPNVFQVIHFKRVHYHKYHHHHHHLHHHHHHHHQQIPCQSVAMGTRRHQPVLTCAFLKSQERPIVSGARSFSKHQVQVILMLPFVIIRQAAGFPLPVSKVPRRASSGEALAKWPN